MALDITQPMQTEADQGWYAERVESLLSELYGRALRLCRRREEDAEDLVAETVARGWQALPTLTDRAALRSWLFRILNNVFVSQCRSRRGRTVHEPLDAQSDSFSLFERLHQPILLWWGSTPEQEFLNRLLRSDLDRAIDALPDPFREVVVLVDVQGLGYREVSELLDVPVGTVRSRLARGRSRLQQALWEHGRDAGLTPRRNRTEQGEEAVDERR